MKSCTTSGLCVGQRRVGRLRRRNGIEIIRTRKYSIINDSNHTVNIAPYLLGQDRKWAGDMSYIWANEGWRYLAVILSLFLASDWLGPSRTCCANPAGQWSAIECKGIWRYVHW